jgi:creatinine amidohydrolase
MPIRPFLLAETNWKALKNAKFDLAVLPWGATEAHNYHLPYATDVIEADHLAAEAARIAWEKGAKVIVLPTIPFGVNTGQTDIYLDINLNPTTQLAILDDVAATLQRQGISKLLLFNSHGGNNFKPLVRELGLRYPGLFVCLSNWFQALDKAAFFTEGGDHADELETSLLLYLRPDLVLPREDWGAGKDKKFRIRAFSEGWVWAERQWSKVSEDTGIGNPEHASGKKGEHYFKSVTEKMGQLFFDLCQADINDLYE